MSIDSNQLLRNILSDMRVKLKSEFDKNFERKAFFSDNWKKRQYNNPKGSLLIVTGTLRRSIRAEVSGNGVRFTSSVPYATVHNEGGQYTHTIKSHKRKGKNGKYHTVKSHTRTLTMPQRQFIGGGKKTEQCIKSVIDANLKKYTEQLARQLKQH